MGFFDNLKRFKRQKMYLYSAQELEEYESFVSENIGEYQRVLHEIVSPDIHLDIITIPPSAETPFYTLVTMGMGAYSMQVPRELKKHRLEHAELLLYLPADWNLQSSDERDYWPIRYLKVLARLPLQCNTWLGYSHTVHANEDMAPLADNTLFNSFVLLNGRNRQGKELDLQLSSGKKIHFYQLFPLYQEELEYDFNHSLEDLLDLFIEDFDIISPIDINRKNYGL